MIITVDYDIRHDFHDIVFMIRANYLCRNNNNCKIKKSRKGYHLYLYLDSNDIETEIFFRIFLLDDLYRLDYDISRYNFGYRLGNVAYNVKSDIYDTRDIMMEKDIKEIDIKPLIEEYYFIKPLNKKVLKNKMKKIKLGLYNKFMN